MTWRDRRPNAGGGGGSGNAGRPALIARNLATWQAGQSDPNGILQSLTMVGRYLRPVLQLPATVSPAPNQGVSWSVPIQTVLGVAATIDPMTMLNQCVLQTLDDDPPGTDVIIGVGLANGPVATCTEGLALALIKSGTDWKIRKYVFASGGSWTLTDAASVSAAVVGGRLVVFNTNSSAQRGCAIVPMDTNGAHILTSGLEPTNTASSTMSAVWTHLFVWAGYQTGVGGSTGQPVTIRGSDLVLRYTDLLKYERANPP